MVRKYSENGEYTCKKTNKKYNLLSEWIRYSTEMGSDGEEKQIKTTYTFTKAEYDLKNKETSEERRNIYESKQRKLYEHPKGSNPQH